MSIQPIEVWGHWGAPNPWKVVMILEALGLQYSIHYLELNEVKTEAYLKLTPNGRLPTIQDPNTNLTLWESGAIIEYLVDEYDKHHRISHGKSPEKYLEQQWLAFQISGQGPYTGQATWFARFHPEKIQSAIDRYVDEIIRVIGVLELGLERNGTGWLVGEKCTYADLSFITWASVGEGVLKQVGKYESLTERYPLYAEWISRLDVRPEVKKIKDLMAKGRAEHGLP